MQGYTDVARARSRSPLGDAARGSRRNEERVSFRITRTAKASWQGTDSDGGGRLALGSGAFEWRYLLRARVEDVERATNPEELKARLRAHLPQRGIAVGR